MEIKELEGFVKTGQTEIYQHEGRFVAKFKASGHLNRLVLFGYGSTEQEALISLGKNMDEFDEMYWGEPPKETTDGQD